MKTMMDEEKSRKWDRM